MLRQELTSNISMDNRATLDTARCRFPTLKSSIARSDVTIDNPAIEDTAPCPSSCQLNVKRTTDLLSDD
jgi:hypothetical protein